MLVNPFTMALWGLIVAGSLAIGFLSAFAGLAVVVPVLAHLASLPQGRGTGPGVAGERRPIPRLRMADIEIGGPGRTGTCNQTVMRMFHSEQLE